LLRSQSNGVTRPLVPYLRTPTSEEEVPYWTNEPSGSGISGNQGAFQNAGGITGRQTLPINGSRAIPVINENDELLNNAHSITGRTAQAPDTTGQPPTEPTELGGWADENWNQNMGMNLDNPINQMTPISGQGGTGTAPTPPPKSAFEPSSNAYVGTMRGLLARNLGQYVVATFLMGPQNIMTWEGFLHSVGENYLVLYQPSRRRYASAELSGLKFIEFYEPNNVIPGFGETYR